MCIKDTLFPQILSKNIKKLNTISATPHSRNYFDYPVTHGENQVIQIFVSFDFHNIPQKI